MRTKEKRSTREKTTRESVSKCPSFFLSINFFQADLPIRRDETTPKCTLESPLCGIPAGSIISVACRSKLLNLNAVLTQWVSVHGLEDLWAVSSHSALPPALQERYLKRIAQQTNTSLSSGQLVDHERAWATVQHQENAANLGHTFVPLFENLLDELDSSLIPLVLEQQELLQAMLLVIRSGFILGKTLIEAWCSVPSSALGKLISQVSPPIKPKNNN